MRRRKTLQELTIMDGFLFGAVMSDPENCRILLERVLEIPIARVEVIQEKSLVYHPEYKGIRLDVFAKDDNENRFDVEVQIRNSPVVKRSRYYHSQMDMDMLLSGVSYKDLPDSYVIFICGYDPFSLGKYRYRIESHCRECPEIDYQDGIHTIILNNHGTNPEEVPKELVSFLEFTRKPLDESEEKTEDDYISMLQETIREIKSSREMGERYMTFEEMLKEEREEGREEGRVEGRVEGRNSLLIQLVNDGVITLEQGSKAIGISTDEFQQLISDSAKL